MSKELLAWKVSRLRGEILELRSAVYQLDRAGLGNATVQLLLNRKCAELDGLVKQCRVAANDRRDDHIK